MRKSLLVCISLITSSALAEEWWHRNVEEYSYKKNTYGMMPTGEKIHVRCMLANDDRHRILVDDDWTNKVKALGYKSDKVAYRVISVSNVKKASQDPGDWWYDAVCYVEIMHEP